ncbi:MAG: universal stress protein [Candidatus Marinimicrobia bacterium]|nr:universal stress protein [Candidatus Neomarinimicrobiota bacterium]
MKFLLAISSSQYSGPTLKAGAMIAQAFNAELNVVYVGAKHKGLQEGPLELSRENLTKWNIYHPGIEVLEWAFKELQLVCPENDDLRTTEFNPEHIKQEHNRYKIILPTTGGCRVALTLREGELIQELRDELQLDDYALTIIGGSQGKRHMAHDLIQFLPSSVFIARGMNLKKKYKILLLVDDSEATKRSIKFGVEIARTEQWDVRTLTVSKTKRFGKGYSEAARQAKTYLEKQDIPVEQFFLTGDPVTTFVDFAGDDHIIIMGASTANPLKKLLFGSKPIKTLKRSSAPILIVK